MVEKGNDAKIKDYDLVLNVNTNLFPGYGSVNMHLYATLLSIYPAICYLCNKISISFSFQPMTLIS